MSEFEYRMPNTISELVEYLKEANAETYLLGGGTDFVIKMRSKGLQRGTIIDMTGIHELDEIKLEDGYVRIGANVTYSRLAESPVIHDNMKCLAQMALKVGSKQIQNMGRLPGNIANASKAVDSIGVLIALDASAKLINSRGEIRVAKVDDIIQGMGKTDLTMDEAIIEVLIPLRGSGTRSGYGKIGHGGRNELTIANASLTIVVEYDKDKNVIKEASIVIGSVAPKAFHAISAEAYIRNKRPDKCVMGGLASHLEQEVEKALNGNTQSKHKINDIRGLAFDVFWNIFLDVI